MVKINAKKILIKILYWIFFAFLAYLIFELARKILGGSLGFEEIVIGLLVANLGYSFYLTHYINNSISRLDSKMSGHIGWHKGRDDKR